MPIDKEIALKRIKELNQERAAIREKQRNLSPESIEKSLETELIRHYQEKHADENRKLIVEKVVPIGKILDQKFKDSKGRTIFRYRAKIKVEESKVEDPSKRCKITLLQTPKEILERPSQTIAMLEIPGITHAPGRLVSRLGEPRIECERSDDPDHFYWFNTKQDEFTWEEDLELDEEAKRIVKEHKERIESQREMLNQLINQLGGNIGSLKTLEDYISLQESQLVVGRAEHRVLDKSRKIDSRPFYSLWIDGKQVFLYDGEHLSFLHSPKKTEPLTIKGIQTRRILNEESIRKAAEELGLEAGDYINSEGITLTSEQQQTAENIFEQVLNGVKILPSPKHSDGYRIKRKGGEEKEIVYRHWGQEHLAQLGPNRIIPGQLLGSGGSYKAYQFGDRTIVEFDQEDRATYLFDTGFFEGLRVLNRARILQANPDGFNGRIIHHQNRDAWKSGVTKFLSPQETLEEIAQGEQ